MNNINLILAGVPLEGIPGAHVPDSQTIKAPPFRDNPPSFNVEVPDNVTPRVATPENNLRNTSQPGYTVELD